jgi:hypothetical protein
MNDFRISPIFVWILLMIKIGIQVCMICLKPIHNPLFMELFLPTIILQLLLYVILIPDIYKSNIDNKAFWVLSIFILADIGQIAYLFRRNQLLSQ